MKFDLESARVEVHDGFAKILVGDLEMGQENLRVIVESGREATREEMRNVIGRFSRHARGSKVK